MSIVSIQDDILESDSSDVTILSLMNFIAIAAAADAFGRHHSLNPHIRLIFIIL